MRNTLVAAFVMVALTSQTGLAAAQATPAAPQSSRSTEASSASVKVPPGYVVGPADVLSIVFYRDKEMSADVVVRPDGKISLPLLNEINAAGQTQEALRTTILEAASRILEDPDVTVQVREIKSRNVYITGNVARPATYPLNGEMTVLQLIAVAGGLLEYADAKNIGVLSADGVRHKFNYKDVVRQKNIAQNIQLKPGDTVVVP